ncbi:MAG: peptidase U32 family protein [Planctomycetota bacterium]|jgi:putative protease
MRNESKIQLNAPAGNLPSLVAAVDAGADSVYIGFRSPTNLRNLPGLNFSVEEASKAVQYAHRRGVKVYVTVNTYPTDHKLEECFRAVDDADDIGADAVIVADCAVLEYTRNRHQRLEIHLSCVAGAADPAAIRFYHEEFGVSCVILPRVLSLEQIAALRQQTDVLLEAMVFGVSCANYDGRCCLSSFITGTSAHSVGACAPAKFVRFEETEGGRTTLRLNGIVINNFSATGARTYPTPCKGKYYNPVIGHRSHMFQEPCCLNALPLLPKLVATGVDIVKIEGRQRSLAYVRLVTSIWREAIDALNRGESFDHWKCENMALESVLEGMASSLGTLSGG